MVDLIADPFRAARLVLSLRRQGITNDGVLAALETVDRGAFVSDGLSSMGGEDCALPILCGQSIPKPIITARLLKALDVSPGKEDRVLLVGAGSGYTAALLAQVSRHVYAVERFSALVDMSQKRLAELRVENVSIRHGDGLEGLGEHGPFDRILLAGAVKTVPAILLEQLTKPGKLVAPIASSDGSQILRCFAPDKTFEDHPMPDRIGLLVKGQARSL